jgi:hypothetical protein
VDARYPFTPSALVCAPAEPGVYLLWDREVLLFVGEAKSPSTIQSRLMDHYCARARPSQATHCSFILNVVDWMGPLGRVGVPAAVESSIYAEAD